MESFTRLTRSAALTIVAMTILLIGTYSPSAAAAIALTQVSADPFNSTTCPGAQHKTEAEPDTFIHNENFVSTFQVGRFFDGGACAIGWATFTASGTFANGFLNGITKFQGNGPFDAASDPVVAFDAKHNLWLISSLAVKTTAPATRAVLVTRSTNNLGTAWSNSPVVVTGGLNAPGSKPDKNWIVCDNSSISPFFGNCYTHWADEADSFRIKMSTSHDGGLTWSPPKNTADNAIGQGGQPVARPDGAVVVPVFTGNQMRSFRSINGGQTWEATKLIAAVFEHKVAGNLRTKALPSAEIDAAGTVYVVWQDCRFRSNCQSNDIMIAKSFDGTSWPLINLKRVPIDPATSTVDHFIPGIGVDKSISGASTIIGLTYYYYPNFSCTEATCKLYVGFVSSSDGGASWSAPLELAGPMSLGWLANTNGGRMVGDYISTSVENGAASTVFAVANPPSGGLFDQAMFAPG